jgi:hypothetical protein
MPAVKGGLPGMTIVLTDPSSERIELLSYPDAGPETSFQSAQKAAVALCDRGPVKGGAD